VLLNSRPTAPLDCRQEVLEWRVDCRLELRDPSIVREGTVIRDSRPHDFRSLSNVGHRIDWTRATRRIPCRTEAREVTISASQVAGGVGHSSTRLEPSSCRVSVERRSARGRDHRASFRPPPDQVGKPRWPGARHPTLQPLRIRRRVSLLPRTIDRVARGNPHPKG
jgi:hypothetical protein